MAIDFNQNFFELFELDYSVDINNMIRMVLQVRSNQRPGCDKLLGMPFMVKRMENKMTKHE